jgi:hypothetical protein
MTPLHSAALPLRGRKCNQGRILKYEDSAACCELEAWAKILLFLTKAGEPPNGCPNFRWRLRRPDQSESPLMVHQTI